jgi:tetratricopeptide (TPR) repeat protein
VWEGRAAAACDRATRLNADLPEVLAALGDLHFNGGNFAEAIHDYRRALGFAPELYEAMLGLARALEASGEIAAAEETCRRAIEAKPGDWRGYSYLGFLYSDRGEYARAIDPCGRVVELTPDNSRGHHNLGSALFHLDRFEEAVKAYQASNQIRPGAATYSNHGTVLYFLGRYEEAVAAFEKAVALVPTDPLWWGNLGNACRWIGGLDDRAAMALDRAIDMMREKLQRNPGEANSWARLAGWLASRGRSAEAIETIRHALALSPHEVKTMVEAGHVYFEVGQKAEALHWLREAVRHGYGPEALRRTPAFAPLRNDPEFLQILQESPAKAGSQSSHDPKPGRTA